MKPQLRLNPRRPARFLHTWSFLWTTATQRAPVALASTLTADDRGPKINAVKHAFPRIPGLAADRQVGHCRVLHSERPLLPRMVRVSRDRSYRPTGCQGVDVSSDCPLDRWRPSSFWARPRRLPYSDRRGREVYARDLIGRFERHPLLHRDKPRISDLKQWLVSLRCRAGGWPTSVARRVLPRYAIPATPQNRAQDQRTLHNAQRDEWTFRG